MSSILQLITIGARIFSDERQEYFQNRSKKLLKKIIAVEDSSFYDKDMEAKGKAERALMIETDELRIEFVKAAVK